MKNEFIDTLRKRALGYTAHEHVREYDADGNEVKQRVSEKDIVPDMTALKMLIEMGEEEPPSELELVKARQSVLEELALYYESNGLFVPPKRKSKPKKSD